LADEPSLFAADQPDPPAPPPPDADAELSLAEHERKYGSQPPADGDDSGRREERRDPADQPAEPPADPDAETPERDENGRFKPKRHRAASQQATPEDVPRIRELTARLRAAEAERDALKTRVSGPAPASSAAALATSPPSPVAATPKPTPEQFSDWTEYNEALTDWKVDQKLAAAEAKRAEAERQRSIQTEQQRLQSSWSERVKAAKAELPDFEEVALLSDTAIPQGSLIDGWILEHKAGAKILYHLQKHPDELQAMLAQPLFEQAESLALLAQRLNGHSTRRQDVSTGSSASVPQTLQPRPPNPVRTGPVRAPDEPPDDAKATLADHERFWPMRSRRV
jgi:hypothetical protein